MSQIFKKPIPVSILAEFLRNHSIQNKNCYFFNIDAFKKLSYIQPFLQKFYEECEPYYFQSKKKYLQNYSFNALTTILRQICNYHRIPFTTKIKYFHSTYSIDYYFFLTDSKE